MVITRNVINEFFCEFISSPDTNVLSYKGFVALADWSEQQDWWQDFAKLHRIDTGWRSSHMGDPYLYALALFRFINHLRGY
ncbi:MAG: hypothetical protein WA003_01550 [Desulfuromonadaceae bacterium]